MHAHILPRLSSQSDIIMTSVPPWPALQDGGDREADRVLV